MSSPGPGPCIKVLANVLVAVFQFGMRTFRRQSAIA